MHLRNGILALTLVLTLAVPARPARADSSLHLKIDWAKAYFQGMQWLVANGDATKTSTMEARAASEASSPSPGSTVAEEGNSWLNGVPHLSLVGRDWGEAHLLAGRLATTDVFRLSRSSRMVVARIRFGDGIIVPFAQLGLGQWRVDTNVLPGWVCDTEVAGQVGGGFELRIAKAYAIAVESDYTMLYRDQREPQNIPFPRFWGTTAASRVRF
jgi:hypothetical protein